MADTKLIALLGTPLGQSFSPRMQNEAYAAINFDAHYFPLECDNELIGNNIANIKKDSSFAGFAVTKPNKEFAVQFMDEMDSLAEKMGTINTVVKQADGTLKGYNTDGFGATKSMELEGVKFDQSTFFVWVQAALVSPYASPWLRWVLRRCTSAPVLQSVRNWPQI